MKVGRTLNSKGELVDVFECPYCKMRTTHEEDIDSHDCKRWSDAAAESEETHS
jgi:hypothetical protein